MTEPKSMASLETELAVALEKIANYEKSEKEAADVVKLAWLKLAELKESRAQAITELEAARKTADAAMERENKTKKLMAETNIELTKTIKRLGDASSQRERFKEEKGELQETLKQAHAKIRELMEDRDEN